MGVLTYDPKKVILTFGGHQLTGFAEGTAIKIKRKEDMWTMQIGVDGEGTRSKSNNKSAEVEAILMQSSNSNDALSILALVDENTNGAALPLTCVDLSGRSLFQAESAWIRKYPDSDFADKAGPRSWFFDIDLLVVNVAGN
jgi:hypothetical protein